MSARAENLVSVLNAGSSSLKFALFDIGFQRWPLGLVVTLKNY
jgi:acetate kinase